jgi:hypothetical protein
LGKNWNPVLYLSGNNARLWVIGCNFEDADNTMIQSYFSYNTVFISDNSFGGWAGATEQSCIAVATGAYNWTVTGNQFNGRRIDTGVITGDYGIKGIGVEANFIIADNTFRNIVLTPVVFEAGQPVNSVIRDNVGIDTSIALTGDAQTFDITHLVGSSANQTITLPDGYAVGCRKMFNMTDAANPMTLVVTHDANASGGASSYVFDNVNAFAEFVWTGHQWKSIVVVQ